MKIALLGLPQAGKKTLFSLLTGRHVPESRKPGEALDGVAPIRDPRVDALAEICRPQRTVYAENHFVLCPDVGETAGKRDWLDTARRCDLIGLVIRAFESDQVYHPAGKVDAIRDRDNLLAELVFADMEIAEKRLARIDKEKRAGLTTEQAIEQTVLKKCMLGLEGGTPIRQLGLDEHELAAIRSLEFITEIPLLCAYNVSEDQLGADYGPGSLTVSCRIEEELTTIGDDAERAEYMQSLGLTSSGLDRMNAATYDALGLMSFYTIGKDEARAWTIRKGSPAPVAGGKIHSDIERGFIRVEIIKYNDLIAAGSEKETKERGQVHLKGKDYIMEDGDVCHFLFNV